MVAAYKTAALIPTGTGVQPSGTPKRQTTTNMEWRYRGINGRMWPGTDGCRKRRKVEIWCEELLRKNQQLLLLLWWWWW